MNAAIKDQAAALPSHNGTWLRVTRGAWYLLAALALGIFIVSLPGFALLASEDLRAGVQSPVILAFGLLAAISAILVALLSLGLAWVLFRRGGQDRMAMLVSFFLLAHGVTTAGPLEGLEPFLPGAANLSVFVLQPALLTPLTIFLFAVFPDGRFVPSWSRWIVVFTVVLTPLMVIFSPVGPVENLGDVQGALIGLSYLSLFVVAAAMIYAQVYRYRRISTLEQRQQTKWVIYGIALWFLLGALSAGPWLALQAMPPDSPLPGWAPVLSLIWVISIAVFPASLAIAVMRHRLWDIDVVINRTLVYGMLTAGVVGLYALVVGSASVVFQSGSNLVGVLMATLLVVAVFRPLRSRLQRGVDRLLPATVDRPIGKETPPGGEAGERTETLAVSAAARPGVSQQRGKALNAQPESNTRLHGPWLAIARLTWFVLTTLTLVVWVAALPSVAGVLQRLPAGYYEMYVGFTALLMLAYVSLAILIFWRRSDDWFALIVSLAIVTGGASTSWVYHAAYDTQSSLLMLNTLVLLLGSAAPAYLLYTFPDGRFVPRWTRPVFILSLLWIILSILFPDEPYSVQRGTGLSVLLLLIAFGSMLAGQVYRYKFVSTPVQRQQTKWVRFGFAAGLGLLAVTGILSLAFPELADHPLGVFFSIIFWPIVYMILPLTIGFAVLRYRLWDIDIVINRTLVFGALTALIVALYVLLVGAFGALFRSSDNLLVSLLATGLAAILFQPLRERLQRGVNRLMYGERDDPYAVLSRLGRRLEASLSPGASLTTIVETVAQALKLPYAAIALAQDDQFRIAASYGLPVDDPVRLPLVYQAETIGQLILAPRAPGESFTLAEQRLLENVAHQAGVAAHAVRLTDDLKQLAADLQRSRERLVVAREEERRRLRRDLHDGLGPALASLTLKLDAARNLLQRDPPSTDKLLAELKTQTQTAIADIRRLVYDLRPPALDELGLVAAIREQAARCKLDGLSVSVEAPEYLPPLPAAVEVAAYRIASEALTNVVRHAHARSCLMRLSFAALEAARRPPVLRATEAEGERKVVTILFADISGFTALSETLHSEQVTDILNACFQTMTDTVAKHGGVVDKYIGDAILALFGVPDAHEDDPERAIYAALAMQAALKETVAGDGSASPSTALRAGLSTSLTLHIGINTGPVVAGTVGVAGQRAYTVLGDAVNLALLLKDAAPSGHVYVGAETYRQTSRLFEFAPVAPIHIKGKRDPVQVYDVRARAATPGTMRGIESLRSPPIGRAAEPDALQLEIVDDGVGLPTAPRGRAGVGLTSMRERAAELGGTCLIERVSTGGTRVVARLPLSRET